jgi:hypothetical protein
MPRWGLLTKSMRFEWWTPYVRLGGTKEEAMENYEKQIGRGSGISTIEDLTAFHKSAAPLRPRTRRPKPEGAPLTKTELKRQATKERIRARVAASVEKHADLIAKIESRGYGLPK